MLSDAVSNDVKSDVDNCVDVLLYLLQCCSLVVCVSEVSIVLLCVFVL